MEIRSGLILKRMLMEVPSLLTTNVGNSVAKGIEAFGELSLLKLIDPTNRSGSEIRIFSSVAFDDAKVYKRCYQ